MEQENKTEKVEERLNYDEFLKKYNLSYELADALAFMETEMTQIWPTYTIGAEYLLFSTLVLDTTMIIKCFKNILNKEYTRKILEVRDGYKNYIKRNSVAIMRPNAKIKYSKDFMELLYGGLEYCDGAPISSLNILSYIMNVDENNENTTLSIKTAKKIFNKIGITLEKVNEYIDDIEDDISFTTTTTNSDDIIAFDKDTYNFDNGDLAKKTFLKLITPASDDSESALDMNVKKGESFVKKYCVNLKEMVANGKITEIYGREYETREIIRVLGRKKKNNAILVGDGGVGKTAIVEGLAYNIYNNINIPEFLMDKEIVSLNLTAVFAGTTLRGMFEERIYGLLDEIKKSNKYILFIDDIGNALSDKQKNDYELSSMLSKSLENGDLNVIGTCDFKSYRKTFNKDTTLARRFQKIVVEKPTIPEAIDMVKRAKVQYEQFHNVHISDDVVTSLVNLASTYVTDRNLPDSAIDIIDEAGSQFGRLCDDNELVSTKQNISEMEARISSLIINDEYKEADDVTKELKKLKKDFNKKKKERDLYRQNNPTEITLDNILNIISEITKIPVSQLNSDEKKKLNSLNERLKNSIIGQDENIDTICKAIKRNRIGLRNTGCMYSALLIGQTGVGKTLTAKKLAREMFGSEDAIIRFDMSEYTDSAAVSKLIGSNPGYIGYEDGGLLTEAIKNKKYCVLLLDEIEKTDAEIYNIFLQVLDEGFLTDNTGMRVDFKNVIVLFTSNVGARKALDFKRGIGFFSNEEENAKHIFSNELKNTFSPEFLNRIDNVIYFNPLDRESLEKIIVLEMNNLKKRLNNINFDMSWNNKVIDYLHQKLSSDTEYGARPIKRMIQDNIEDKITDILINNDFEKHTFKIDVNKKEEITVK